MKEKGKFTVPRGIAAEGTTLIPYPEVQWYWSTKEIEVEEPDHVCSPDCVCLLGWKKPEVIEIKKEKVG